MGMRVCMRIVHAASAYLSAHQIVRGLCAALRSGLGRAPPGAGRGSWRREHVDIGRAFDERFRIDAAPAVRHNIHLGRFAARGLGFEALGVVEEFFDALDQIHVRPALEDLHHEVTADAQQESRIANGQSVLVRESEAAEGDWIKLVNQRRQFIAVGTVIERIGDRGVGVVQPKVVFK